MSASAQSTLQAASVPSTRELLETLDRADEVIPKLIQQISSAVGFLLDETADQEKVNRWERNLKGLAPIHYHRLNTLQIDLRTIVRHLHILKANPENLRPTLGVFPPAFASTQDAQLRTSTRIGGADAADVEGKNGSDLGIYAQRLELHAIRDLKIALNGLQEEAGRVESHHAPLQEEPPAEEHNGAVHGKQNVMAREDSQSDERMDVDD